VVNTHRQNSGLLPGMKASI